MGFNENTTASVNDIRVEREPLSASSVGIGGGGAAVSFERHERFPGFLLAPDFFASLIEEYGVRRILEIGSGANPTLHPDYVQRNGLSYVTSDIDGAELDKADPVFERMILDLSHGSVPPSLLSSFDCVFSRMVNEHVKDGQTYHRNIYSILRPGGISVHCFSTLWALPFSANRLLPEFLTRKLLGLFNPRDDFKHGKFKAYYSWSRGPSHSILRRLRAIGFEVVRYTGYFGHGYYWRRLRWLHQIEEKKTEFLVKHPVPQLCSYALVILRRPLEGVNES